MQYYVDKVTFAAVFGFGESVDDAFPSIPACRIWFVWAVVDTFVAEIVVAGFDGDVTGFVADTTLLDIVVVVVVVVVSFGFAAGHFTRLGRICTS